jgi:hypothetical protein
MIIDHELLKEVTETLVLLRLNDQSMGEKKHFGGWFRPLGALFSSMISNA